MRRFCKLLWLFLWLVTATATAQQPKYIFLFIGDGMGINHVRGTELYNAAVYPDMANGGELSFTRFPVRTFCNTHSASSLVTDSAAAGTALATGVKTSNQALGVDADKQPIKNLGEIASDAGMMVGVASNVPMNHATPSVFYAHNESRRDYNSLFEQYLSSSVDFAAGSTILHRKKQGYTIDLCIEKARKAGIVVTQNSDEAARVKGRRVLLLSDSLSRRNLRFTTDRTADDPTIVDYADAAIRYMEREAIDCGFFMMIEAGHIDYSAHDNDAVTTFEEINDLSRSVALALEFYERYPDQTLIVVTADHETGGLTLGYTNYKMALDRLAYQRTSLESLTAKMQYMRERGKTSWEEIQTLLRRELGLWDRVRLREKDEEQLRQIYENNFLKQGEKVVGLYTSNEKLAAAAVTILNKRAYVKWTCLNHTGAQVPLFAKGCCAEEFMQCRDNTDVAKIIKRILTTKR